MTQAEIEAELLSQRQQLLQIAARTEKREQDKRRLANAVTGMAIAFLAVAVIIELAGTPARAQALPLFFTIIPLSFLAIALRI